MRYVILMFALVIGLSAAKAEQEATPPFPNEETYVPPTIFKEPRYVFPRWDGGRCIGSNNPTGYGSSSGGFFECLKKEVSIGFSWFRIALLKTTHGVNTAIVSRCAIIAADGKLGMEVETTNCPEQGVGSFRFFENKCYRLDENLNAREYVNPNLCSVYKN